MATDTEHHHGRHHDHRYSSNHWAQSEMASEAEELQVLSISDILNHGSISFGRFAAEPLAWEKWSVFSHNKCQEELEKFKAPGFVAQKKAYFEEYYRGVRATKALQAERQETPRPHACLVAKNCTSQLKNTDLIREENKPINGSLMKTVGNEVTGNRGSTELGIPVRSKENLKEELSCRDNDNDKAITTGECNISATTADTRHPVKKSVSAFASSDRSTKIAHHDFAVSVAAKNEGNTQKKQAPMPKAKARVSSSENKTEVNGRIAKGATKPSEKPKLSSYDSVTGTTDKSLVSFRRTPKTTKETKPNCVASSEERSSANGRHNSLVKDRSVASPVSVAQVKANSASKGLINYLPTKLPLHERSTQRTIKETTHPGTLRKKALDNRREKKEAMLDSKKNQDLPHLKLGPKTQDATEAMKVKLKGSCEL